jgi:subtilisin family serine protease
VLHLLLILLLIPIPHAPFIPDPNIQPFEVLIRFETDITLTATARISAADQSAHNVLAQALAKIDAVQALPLGDNTYRLRIRHRTTEQALHLLHTTPGIRYAEPNHLRTRTLIPNDPLLDRQATLNNIRAPEAWEISTGAAIPIAILDTGVSPTHLDLKNKLLPGYDFLNRDSDPRDDDGHGTYTAGVAAAESNNALGVSGICWGCPIMPIKVLNRRGQGDDATIAEGIRWATDNGARIINMSLGGPEDTSVLRDAVAYATERGVLVVAASGNGQADGNLPSYPAAYSNVLAVSATRNDDSIAGFSTTGGFVDIAAPGAGVLSTTWSVTTSDSYGVGSGTSAACPQVAAAAGLMLSVRSDLRPDQLSDLLALGADDQGVPGRDPEYGYGRLNIRRSLEIASDPESLRRSRIEGVIAGAPSETLVLLNDGRSTRSDANGFFRFEGLSAGTYTVRVGDPALNLAEQQASVNGTALSIATLQFGVNLGPTTAFAPVGPPSDPSVLYFQQTGHTLRGAFRRYWQEQGGLPIFGYPISEELSERSDDGRERVVQYFERHRLELHPENQPPYDIQLTRIGDLILRQQGRNWYDFAGGSPQSNCMFFEATNHSICEPFLSYWRANGLEFDRQAGKSTAESLALFGLPLSEPVIETTSDGRLLVVQWFERARFEDHGSDGVLLGLLGNELARGQH